MIRRKLPWAKGKESEGFGEWPELRDCPEKVLGAEGGPWFGLAGQGLDSPE